MKFSPRTMKWLLRFYPPFFFQRIWVKNIHKNYMGADVVVSKSLLNINSNKTIFGGTIFSAVDPIYPILVDSYLRHQGFKKTVVWLKSAHIDYIKPGAKNLTYSVRLDQSIMDEAVDTVKNHGKIVKSFRTEIFDTDGTLCAVTDNEIYIRDLTFDFNKNN